MKKKRSWKIFDCLDNFYKHKLSKGFKTLG
jgi:hypothetical protein